MNLRAQSSSDAVNLTANTAKMDFIGQKSVPKHPQMPTGTEVLEETTN